MQISDGGANTAVPVLDGVSCGPALPLEAEVAIVGAGLSGAVLALLLARRGVGVALADPHARYRADFRCEKLNPGQVALLREMGLADVLSARIASGAEGFRYADLVNAVRAAWPETVRFVPARVDDIAWDGTTATLVSDRCELIRARLAVLATGPSPALSSSLGLTRRTIRERHSICIGFSLAKAGGFGFDGLVQPGERAGDRIGFVSLFPRDGGLRANLFSYHEPTDGWVRAAAKTPIDALFQIAPKLRPALEGAEVTERPEVRVTDLYRTENPLRPGLVLIGDAYQASCPATAVGITRVLTDAGRLAQAHLPEWLRTPGMSASKIAGFYADPVKSKLDEEVLQKADRARSAAVETSLKWRAYRWAAAVKRRAAARR